MEFSLAGKYFYGLYRNLLCDLYINTFSQKPVSQYHNRQTTLSYYNEVNTNCFSYVFIRVWDQNIPAITLYEKMGFNPVASVVQSALRVDKSGMRDFRKTYMVKEIKAKINGASDI